jgi:hypothetical protein
VTDSEDFAFLLTNSITDSKQSARVCNPASTVLLSGNPVFQRGNSLEDIVEQKRREFKSAERYRRMLERAL